MNRKFLRALLNSVQVDEIAQEVAYNLLNIPNYKMTNAECAKLIHAIIMLHLPKQTT